MNNENDTKALDWIAETLRAEEWDPEILERIAEVIEWTGRDISPTEKEEDD